MGARRTLGKLWAWRVIERALDARLGAAYHLQFRNPGAFEKRMN